MALLKTAKLHRGDMNKNPLSIFNQALQVLNIPEEEWENITEIAFNYEPDSIETQKVK